MSSYDRGEKSRLRIGRYHTQADKGGQGARPFVYVPDGFDLERDGAVVEVLKAAGISDVLGQDAPSMVMYVPKQGTHVEKLEDAAAVREKAEDGRVVLLSNDGYEREASSLDEGDSDDSALALHTSWTTKARPARAVTLDESLFKRVDDAMSLKTHRAALRGRVKRLIQTVSQCCEQARAVMIFDNARRNNPQLDLFTDSGGAVLLGTYEAKDLVAWLSLKEKEPDDKIDESKNPWWDEAKLRGEEPEFLGDKRTIDYALYASGARKPPNALALPDRYDNRPRKDRVRDVPHKAVTHALFFSSDQKRRQFEGLLAEAVPDGLLLIGGTPHSFRRARQALRAGKPIFVIDETGGAASLFSAMFKTHQERALENNSSPWPGPNQQEAVCIAQNWHVYFEDYDRNRPPSETRPWHNWKAWNVKDRIHRSQDPVGAVLDAIATEGAWPPAANDSADCAVLVIPPDIAEKDLPSLSDVLAGILSNDQEKTSAKRRSLMRAWGQSVTQGNSGSGSSALRRLHRASSRRNATDADISRAQAINDSAVGGIDRYDSGPLAAALVDVLRSANPPVCVGLLAKWGSGKSFLIHQLKRRLDPCARETPTNDLVQWFEGARDGRAAYHDLPKSAGELKKVEELQLSDILKASNPKLQKQQKCFGLLGVLLFPFFFCFNLIGNAWKALKPYWIDTACNILLDAWRAFTGCRTHYQKSKEQMRALKVRGRSLSLLPPDRTGDLLPSDDLESQRSPRKETEFIFVDFNAWEFYATEELWTGLLRELYSQVEARLAMTRKGPIDPEPSKDWKRSWRAQTAQKKLNEQYGVVGLRARAIVAVSTFLAWLVLILLAAIGVRAWWYGFTAFIGHAADSVVRLRVLKLSMYPPRRARAAHRRAAVAR